MSHFEGNDEEVPRAAPKQKEVVFQSPTAPVVPEVSMVLMGEKSSDFYKKWGGATTNTTWRDSTNPLAKTFPTQKPTEAYSPSLQVKTFKKSPKSQQFSTHFRPEKTMDYRPLSKPKIIQNPPKIHEVPTVQLPQFSFPPPPIPTQAAILAEKKISEQISQQLKSHEIQINELKELIEKLTAEFIELKAFESAEHENIRKLLEKPKINYASVGIQCKLDEEIVMNDDKQEANNKIDKRSAALKTEATLEIVKKSTGSIPKTKAATEISDEKPGKITLKMHFPKAEVDQDKYEILSSLPRSRFNEAMEIMALTCKYIPKEKLKEWGFTVKEPGKADVSMATRRYMEKYGLIGPIPEEKDEEVLRDPEATDCSGDSSDKILDTKAIKNQPKFM